MSWGRGPRYALTTCSTNGFLCSKWLCSSGRCVGAACRMLPGVSLCRLPQPTRLLVFFSTVRFLDLPDRWRLGQKKVADLIETSDILHALHHEKAIPIEIVDSEVEMFGFKGPRRELFGGRLDHSAAR